MAPARMMQFVDQHVKGCKTCQSDLLLSEEVEKIREFILPESKIPKAVRDESTPEISSDEDDDEFDTDSEFADDIDDEDDLEDPLEDEEDDSLSGDDVI